MNFRLVAKHLAMFVFAAGGFMLPAAAWAVYETDWPSLLAFLGSMACAGALGGVLRWLGRPRVDVLTQREALGLVSISWFFIAGIGALPYVLAGVLGPIDAYFESMSGFTTTGSTVIVNIEATPKSILLWRSFTQWLGGMGIIVLFIAVLPYLGAGGKLLFRSETTGPDTRGITPRIHDTASILYRIYIGFTIAEVLALMLAGMGFYDALTHTFSTISTGGFSPKQASVGAFNSVAVELIIIFFMICGGVNFALYFAMFRRRDWKIPLRDTEWKIFIAILVVATSLIALNLVFAAPPDAPPGVDGTYGFGKALRVAAFQVVSIMTTTGFGTDDFDNWPHFSQMIMVLVMFIGGCAGSTAGGMKVVRIIMLAKMAYWSLETTFRPKTIRAVRVSGEVVDDDVQKRVQTFFTIYIVWFVAGSIFMSMLGLPFETALSAVITTLGNVGPGLELVGASEDFSVVPAAGKLFLTVCMVLGRLELFSVCVLFIPAFWRHS